MTKPTVLLQLDTDAQASVFDSVVAIDSGVDHLLRHQGVTPEGVRDLVYGAMFTRGPQDLKRTAIFVGGSDAGLAEQVAQRAKECYFGPVRVSILLDPNGANTTAAAAVLAAEKHLPLSGAVALVLAATGPVGRRAVRLLARAGATVRVASRRLDRAQEVCQEVAQLVDGAKLAPHDTSSDQGLQAALDGAQLVVAAGPPGVEMIGRPLGSKNGTVRVAIDLNAVPPAGIAGVESADRAAERNGLVCYGALGVGGTKMKIHKAAVAKLFTANDLILDAEEIFQIGRELK
jgi:hypothetical protein